MPPLKKIVTVLIALFVALVPWQTRLIWHDAFLNGVTWEYGRFSLYATQFLIALIALLYAIWLFRSPRPVNYSVRIIFLRRNYFLMVALLLLIFVSTLWAVNFQLALVDAVTILSVGVVASAIIVMRIPLYSLVCGFVGGGVVQAIFAVRQFFVQYVPAQKWLGLAVHAANIPGAIVLQTDTERWLRAYGSFPHPNILGGYLVLALLGCLFLSYEKLTISKRIALALSIAIMTTGLFFTFSRSAWLALFVSVPWFVLYALRRRDMKLLVPVIRFVLVSGMVGIFLAWSYWPLVNSRVTIDSYLEYASLRERVVYIDQALTLISHRPLLGYGIGNYTLGVYTQINSHIPGWLYQPVHNVFLLAWAEVGLLGVLLLAALFTSVGIANFKRITSQAALSLAGLTTIITISFFDHYWWSLYSGIVLFWLIIAIAIQTAEDPVSYINSFDDA